MLKNQVLFFNFIFILLGLTLMASPAAGKDAALSADLGREIANPKQEILLVQVVSSTKKLLCVRLAVAARTPLVVGTLLSIPFVSEGPLGMGPNAWNKMDVSAGAWMILAGLHGKKSIFEAEAGQQVTSQSQGEALLKKPLQYSADPTKIIYDKVLIQAILDHDQLSQSVLLNLVWNDQRMPRSQAAAGLVKTFLSLNGDEPKLPIIASALVFGRLYNVDLGPDEINRQIFGALAKRMLADKPTVAAIFVDVFRSALVQEMSESTRGALIKVIPNRDQLVSKLKSILEVDASKKYSVDLLLEVLKK